MKEFAFGTDEQFRYLENELKDNRCHVYKGCILPNGCVPTSARIGFEKNCEGHYIMYIDKGIRFETNHEDFKCLIDKGEIKFICFEDLVDFLRSLKVFFDSTQTQEPNIERCKVNGKDQKSQSTTRNVKQTETTQVYDPEKVMALKKQKETQKQVWPEEIADPLKKMVFGQDCAIDDIAKKVVINKMRKDKKLLVMALLGPTATGKSQTSKSLADVLSKIYDTPYGFIEIAGSEFVGEHTVHRFFGAPPGYAGYGNDTVLEPVRKNPKHIIVINEIEKADKKLLTGLMEAIDTGYLGMADNSKPIDLNECIMFFTSNIPIDMEKYNTLSRFEKAEMCRDAFTKHCGRPEISGKIGNFVVFNTLTDVATMNIVSKFVREELGNYDLHLVKIDDGLMLDFLNHETKYGARGIRDLVSDSIGEHLLKKRKLQALKNKSVSLSGTIGNIEFTVVQKGE